MQSICALEALQCSDWLPPLVDTSNYINTPCKCISLKQTAVTNLTRKKQQAKAYTPQSAALTEAVQMDPSAGSYGQNAFHYALAP